VRRGTRVAEALDGSSGCMHERVAKRAVLLALTDAVHRAETYSAEGDVTHRLHHIGEHALHALEVEQAAEEQPVGRLP